MTKIGIINETPLHAELKNWYAQSGGATEVEIGRFIIDIVKGAQLIEVQTGHFSSIKTKVKELISNYDVKLVYPISVQKTLIKLPKNEGEKACRRKSPKKEIPQQIFKELVSFPELLKNPKFTIEIALIHIEEIRHYTGEKPWFQNGWVTITQRLVSVLGSLYFKDPIAMTALLPVELPEIFTTADLSAAAEIPRWLSQKMVYCLRKMDTLQIVGKKDRSISYKRSYTN